MIASGYSYRKHRKSRREVRADEVGTLAGKLALPRAALSGEDGVVLVDARRHAGPAEVSVRRACQEFCVEGRLQLNLLLCGEALVEQNGELRPGLAHSRGGILHSRWPGQDQEQELQRGLIGGKWPRVLTARRSLAFRPSIAFVV